MAQTGPRTYADLEDVEGLIGDIIAERHFDESTIPTAQQAVNELDNVAAEINSALATMGYTVPVDQDLYPEAYQYLKAANSYGAAARLLGTIPTEAYDPDEQATDLGQSRAQMYERHLKNCIKRIFERKIKAAMTTGRFSMLKTGAQDKDPLYRRRMGEYPGARILPTSESDTSEDTE